MKTEMKTILYVSVSLNSDMSVKESKCERSDVLAMNERLLVLNNDRFTVLNLKKEKYTTHSNLDHVAIGEEKSSTMIDIFGKFRISVYSTASVKVTENRINKAFNSWIAEKISIYGQAKTINIKLAE